MHQVYASKSMGLTHAAVFDLTYCNRLVGERWIYVGELPASSIECRQCRRLIESGER